MTDHFEVMDRGTGDVYAVVDLPGNFNTYTAINARVKVSQAISEILAAEPGVIPELAVTFPFADKQTLKD